tara:strand:+ start:119 stop:352 length:234 start_codon:yes stop_codon:yes gene_type:complete
MKPDTEYLITWDIDNKQTQGIYTWNGKGIKTSKDTYIKLTRTKDKKVTAPISVKMLIGNVYSPEGIDLDLSKSVPVK